MNPKKHKPNILNFTSKALAHFKHMVSKQGKENKIRLGVKKMGCNGFSYFFEFVNRPNKSDQKIFIENLEFLIPTDIGILLTFPFKRNSDVSPSIDFLDSEQLF